MTEQHHDLDFPHDRELVELRPIMLRHREVADVLGVSERTVYEWRENRGLPFVRIGTTVRYPVAGLERWAAEHAGGG
ncbi:MAG: helix-turn-helix domain-containing protein [Phycisphaerales bacterium]|nr:helix-turn-helix domain-containing protein [Phycisphaerales bacterium]